MILVSVGDNQSVERIALTCDEARIRHLNCWTALRVGEPLLEGNPTVDH